MKTNPIRGLALILIAGAATVVACNAKIDALDDRACPCTTGYTCCAATQQCLAPGQACAAEQTIPNVSMTDGGDDDADPGALTDIGNPSSVGVNGTPMPPPTDTQNVPFLPSTSKPGELRVFVSSTLHDGNFGGFDGADAFCRKTANAAGLGGKWAAYLDGVTVNALDRIQGDGPWYLVDGTTLYYANHDELAENPRAETPEDENGALYNADSGPLCWLGGAPPFASCADWTTTEGNGVIASDAFPVNNVTDYDCTEKHNVLCFEGP